MFGRTPQRGPHNQAGGGNRGAIKSLVFLVLTFCLFALPAVALAQINASDLGLEYATEMGLTTTDIRVTIIRVVNALFGLLGIIVVILILYGGFIYMTSQGDPAKIDTAKKIITNAVIGLVIILAAYAITAFIIQAITGATMFPGGRPPSRTPSTFLTSLRNGPSHHLGNGVIEYHYPERGQIDVPRNTKIAITFKKPFVPSTVFADYESCDTVTDPDCVPTYDLSDDTVGGVP
ncbi:pilin, partial [Patescibacteria group bacterium]